jgi:hypothetical protein
MNQNLTKLYEGANLSGATPGVIYVPVLDSRSLTQIKVKTDENVSGADAVFELTLNDDVITGAEAITITVGNKIGTIGSLAVALVEGDELILNLLSGAVSSPVTLNLKTTKTVNTDELTEVTDKKFVTDAEKTKLGNLSGTNTGDQTISDATISTTDITTNNASTSKHGFLKKLDNDPTHFLDGQGNWSVPSGGGSPAVAAAYHDHFLSAISPNWRQVSTTIQKIDSVAGHPGIVQLISLSNNNVVGMALASSSSTVTLLPSDNFDIMFVLRPVTNDSDTIYRFGLFESDFSNSFSHAILFHKAAADSEFFGECRASGTSTQTSGFGTYTANTWHTFRLRRIDASTIGFTYDGGTESTITTNIPTAGLVPAFYVVRVATANKTLDVDSFDLTFT